MINFATKLRLYVGSNNPIREAIKPLTLELTRLVGGCTIDFHEGLYINASDELMQETSATVECFVDSVENKLESILAAIQSFQQTEQQESILLEVNNKGYLLFESQDYNHLRKVLVE